MKTAATLLLRRAVAPAALAAPVANYKVRVDEDHQPALLVNATTPPANAEHGAKGGGKGKGNGGRGGGGGGGGDGGGSN